MKEVAEQNAVEKIATEKAAAEVERIVAEKAAAAEKITDTKAMHEAEMVAKEQAAAAEANILEDEKAEMIAADNT